MARASRARGGGVTCERLRPGLAARRAFNLVLRAYNSPTFMENPPAAFLDVPALLESSHPRPRVGWAFYAVGAFVFLMLLSTVAGASSAAMGGAVEFLAVLAMVGLM